MQLCNVRSVEMEEMKKIYEVEIEAIVRRSMELEHDNYELSNY